MSVRVEVSGVAGTVRRLASLPGRIQRAVVDEVADTADSVEEQAVDLAPIDRGVLVEAIETRFSQGGKVAEVGIWNDDAYYARFVHDGTSSITADPFLRAAYEAHVPGLRSRIAAAIRDAAERGPA